MHDFFKQVWQMLIASNLLNIFGAILVLLIGWIIALIVSRKISKHLQKISSQPPVLPDGTEIPKIRNSETFLGKTVFWLIMIFTVLACFSILGMTAVTASIQNFISPITGYAANLIGAVLLGGIAWITAKLSRSLTRTLLKKMDSSSFFSNKVQVEKSQNIVDYTANTVYYIVLLFFLPAILNALKIYGITDALQQMFSKIFLFLPNLLAAILILAVGLWAAGIIRRAVCGFLIISRLDSFAENIGFSKYAGNCRLSSMLGLLAYLLIVIPVLISALTALDIEILSRSVTILWNKILNAAGNLAAVALLILAAVLAGKFIQKISARLLENFGFDRFLASLGFFNKTEKSITPSDIAGKLVYIIILVMAILASCEILAFNRLAELIRDFALFGGNLLLSILVLLIGVWLAKLAEKFLTGKCHKLLIDFVRICVILFTLALAIGNINIGSNITAIAFTLLLGAICVAVAIAFGFGGREFAAKCLKDWTEKLNKP